MSVTWLVVVACSLCWNASVDAQEIVDSWRFVVRRPTADWYKPDFDDSEWRQATGGFGTRETPGSRVGTTWATNGIWLRKSIELENTDFEPALLIHHDENAEVYINGAIVATLKGYTTDYKVVPIDSSKRSAIKVGRNLMAVRCNQTTGGQFIDVHLVDAKKVPELPKSERSSKPFVSDLITKWGEDVTADNAWREYPRPQLRREKWTNLNGHWDYTVTPIAQRSIPEEWTGKILVPFCLESKLGGVQRLLDATEALWYLRTFQGERKASERTLLHFEAVDYRCEVFVNGQSVGTHVGGNTPFSFDITDAVVDGDNQLLVRVEDATEAYQLRGKQVINARGIWYTQVSGIWQTVWLEQVPNNYIEDLTVHAAADGSIVVHPDIQGDGSVRLLVKDGNMEVAQAVGTSEIKVHIPDAKLWSPANPYLYELEIQLLDESNKVVDRVESYAGLRTVGKTKDKDGHWRFTLNGEVIFHWGPLDQGWWPDGLLTPPSDEAMLSDVTWLKRAGFNMIRKHIKVEPRRYYYHCDREGMLIWQDQVSGGTARGKHWPKWTRLQPNPKDANWPDEQHAQFMYEFEEMIDSLENHPSIVCWVPFNEAWGQHRTMDVGKWTVQRDPSRHVNVASGGNFWPIGDIVDEHRYPHPGFPFELNHQGRFDDFIKVMGEFGGHGYPVRGHLWDSSRRNWGYGGLPQNEKEYKERYAKSLKLLNELRGQGIAGGIYTQTTDVEGEINGLLTYDRKVVKIAAEELAKLHRMLFEEAD